MGKKLGRGEERGRERDRGRERYDPLDNSPMLAGLYKADVRSALCDLTPAKIKEVVGRWSCSMWADCILYSICN